MSKRILVIAGHSNPESLCHTLARAYTEAARGSGHTVELLDLAALRFDPILRRGYREVQPLEPDLVTAQNAIRDAAHLVIVFPNWWGSMPALLKGFVDRIFLPGFAFKYVEGKPLPAKLLKGRSARLIITMDSPPWYYRLFAGALGQRTLKNAILGFCGISPVQSTLMGPVRGSDSDQIDLWIRTARDLGRAGS